MEATQMGSKKMMVLFLIFFTSLYFLASSSPDHKVFVSDSLQEDNFGLTGRHEEKINGVDSDGAYNGRSGILHSSSHRSTGAGINGGANAGPAENGNGNGNSQRGTTANPVIVAGAANNNRHQNPHRSAANCNRNCIRFSTMIMATLAAVTLHI